MQLMLVNQVVQSVNRSFIQSFFIIHSFIQSFFIFHSLSLVPLVKHLLVQFSLVKLCSRYLVATPCSSLIRILFLSLVTCSFSIYLSIYLSLPSTFTRCVFIPFAAVTRYFLRCVPLLRLFVTRYSLLLLQKVFAR